MSIAVITGASSGLGTCYADAVTKVFPEIEELWLIAKLVPHTLLVKFAGLG